MLGEHCKIEEYLDQGKHDKVFQATYIRKETNEALVVKVLEFTPEFQKEVDTIQKIQQESKCIMA